jgi:hypothetical protein
MTGTVLVLLDAGGAMGPVELFEAAESAHLELIFVVDGKAASDALGIVSANLAPTIRGDFEDPAAMARMLAPWLADGAACVTFVDRLCELRDHLTGVPGGTWCKSRQRELLNTHGLSARAFRTITSAAELDDAVTELRLPCILKPERGVASSHTWLIESVASARAAAHDLAAADRWIMEELIPSEIESPVGRGDYLSVDLFVSGRPRAAVLIDRPPLYPPFREAGTIGPSRFEGTDTGRHLVTIAERAHHSLGLGDGAFHIELKLTQAGAEVIEVNGRLGGFVRKLVLLGSGADVGAWALLAARGELDQQTTPTWQQHVASILIQAPVTATALISGPSPAAVRRLPGVHSVEYVRSTPRPLSWTCGTGGAVASIWVTAGTAEDLTGVARHVTATVESMFGYKESAAGDR